MKTKLTFLLVLTGLGLLAKPVFQPLPGTPEAAALEAAAARSNANAAAAQARAEATDTSAAQPPAATTPVAPSIPQPDATIAPATGTGITSPRPVSTSATAVPVEAAPAARPNPTVTETPPPTRRSRRVANTSAPAAAPATPGNGITLRFQATPLEQVLDFYAEMVNRTMLRAAQLPAASITIKTQSELTREEAIQALDAVLGLNGIVMIPVGEKFIKVVGRDTANQEAAPLSDLSADELPEFGQYVTHVVQLRYAKPSELTQVLQPFAKLGNSILPIDSNGILVLRDFTENVKRMLELIESIDVSVPSEYVSEVIPIRYALASEIASALNSVGGGATTAIGAGGGAPAANQTRTGTGIGNRTGALGTTGGVNNQTGYNQPGGANRGVQGQTGQQAQGQQTFAQRLQNIVNRAASAGGGDFQLIGPNKIIPDERTNSLLVFASRQDMDMIKDIISKLDVVLAQVLIEAMILDVTLADNFNFGVSAGQRPHVLARNVQGGGDVNNANGSLNNGLSFLRNFITGSGTNAVAYPNADGLSYFGSIGNSWDVTITALAGNDKVKVLARPRIQTSHNAPANIFVGETRPYITGTYFDTVGNGSRSQYQQTQIGISLNVTPLINSEGLVVLDIQQQVQQVGGSVTIDNNPVPITQDQNASAKVAVKDGDTIVMGGFIQNTKTEAKSGVPYLKDIPLLGALFRSTKTGGSRRELLVLIRPTVLPTPEAAALQTDIERNRLPIVKQSEAEFEADDARLLKRANRKAKGNPKFQSTEGR